MFVFRLIINDYQLQIETGIYKNTNKLVRCVIGVGDLEFVVGVN